MILRKLLNQVQVLQSPTLIIPMSKFNFTLIWIKDKKDLTIIKLMKPLMKMLQKNFNKQFSILIKTSLRNQVIMSCTSKSYQDPRLIEILL